eukprot:TRINITY_DN2421_c0_g1_i6.p1 TRINITY_DN2421_c0_g1~~TRINITY_DN2421_c0_g1_i6.p1  ORF type:complete len:310 (+),score=50.01 TRINITY_DN2421_c0_g1_i6:105-1034(+)
MTKSKAVVNESNRVSTLPEYSPGVEEASRVGGLPRSSTRYSGLDNAEVRLQEEVRNPYLGSALTPEALMRHGRALSRPVLTVTMEQTPKGALTDKGDKAGFINSECRTHSPHQAIRKSIKGTRLLASTECVSTQITTPGNVRREGEVRQQDVNFATVNNWIHIPVKQGLVDHGMYLSPQAEAKQRDCLRYREHYKAVSSLIPFSLVNLFVNKGTMKPAVKKHATVAAFFEDVIGDVKMTLDSSIHQKNYRPDLVKARQVNLPKRRKTMTNKTLVFDLDETLIHNKEYGTDPVDVVLQDCYGSSVTTIEI